MFYEYFMCVCRAPVGPTMNCCKLRRQSQALIYITLKSTALINVNQSCNTQENTGKQANSTVSIQ